MQRRLITTSNHPLEVFVKNNVRAPHDLEESVAIGAAFAAGVAAARAWASPHVDAAYGWAKPRLEKGIETAGPALQDTVRKATEGVSGGIAVVTPLIQDRIDKVTPALTSAKGKVVDEYLPALSTRLGESADTASRSLAEATVPPVVEKAVIKMTGDKKAVKNAQKRLVAAAMQASKDLKKSKARKSGKGWLVVGIIASAIIAGLAAWRASKPVEDPWKSPAPIKSAPASTSGGTSQEAKDVVASVKEAAERATKESAEPAGDVKTTAADAAAKVAESTKDATEAAKHAAKPQEPKA
jgi:hypothetical protein